MFSLLTYHSSLEFLSTLNSFGNFPLKVSDWVKFPHTQLLTNPLFPTGLDMRSAEELQIANYGIGGHYEPHYDHAREGEDNFDDLGMGNRIATLLMYTSQVTAGGMILSLISSFALDFSF